MSAGLEYPLSQPSASDQNTSPNQRRFRRYNVEFPGRVKPRKSHRDAVLPELKVETLNVSKGGLFFLASTDWMIGTRIEIELDFPALVGRSVTIQCRVTITRVVPEEGGRVGIGAEIHRYELLPSAPQINRGGYRLDLLGHLGKENGRPLYRKQPSAGLETRMA